MESDCDRGVQPWHSLTPEVIAGQLGSDLTAGLSGYEAAARLAGHGPNELPEAAPPSIVRLALSQFSSLIIWVLIGAAVLSGLLQEWIDAGAIVAIVVLNALLGFVQEYKAERSLAALKRLSVVTARVVRDGVVHVLPAQALVPGDLILLEAGDRVPADARLLSATHLRAQEATLTGESTPVEKSSALRPVPDLPLADRVNMVFLGTNVVGGKGRALVVATGLRTELGRIASLLQRTEREPTPLQRRLARLGHVLIYLALAIVSLVFGLGVLRGEPLVDMFLTAVSLAVAAIPEGLPAIVTITLALGVTRMVERHALIRRLPAVETLGATTVICTDKTGTLTKNEMTVTRLYVDGRTFEVTGEGYEPVGDIREVNGEGGEARGERQGRKDGEALQLRPEHPSPLAPGPVPSIVPGLLEVLTSAVLCNGAILQEREGVWSILGDPTEGALLVAAAKRQIRKSELEAGNPQVAEIPFDSDRKMMTVIRQTSDGPVAYLKGAPDVLLGRCEFVMAADGTVRALTELDRQRIVSANTGFAADALRVLGVARRKLGVEPFDETPGLVERNLIFLGLMAMKDPLRAEAKRAVRQCREAGIRTVMITGDHRDTALSIARELGLYDGDGSALTGAELDSLTDAQLTRLVEGVTVFARVSAEHKLRIVHAWKARGAIVAMTGDGVNDAPAIKTADIGVAMGLTGTDVTKEAADMVVTDDNFASIVSAVEEGRTIYGNILKSVHFLLSCNLSEILVMLVATLAGFPLPLLPVQILWINLVTDGLPALALAVDPAVPDVMRRRPLDPQAPVLERSRLLLMGVQGGLLAFVAVCAFVLSVYVERAPLEQARTLTFVVMVLAQLFHAFACRSRTHSIFTLGLFTNRSLILAVGVSIALQVLLVQMTWTDDIFNVVPLDARHWLLAVGLALIPFMLGEAQKAMTRRK
ncbi:MAG TPA: cation-translocating P-type ATPase [Nitrospira sp.]|nr:cation-translocating P-type ATPase [Nitrospira sp.]